jgi:uncharacterized membrane protein HdeD (DUF308 family)
MSTTHEFDRGGLQQAVAAAVREHSTLFLVEGVVLLILGAIAIVVPPLATVAVTIIIGWVFLASGIVGLIATFGARGVPGFWWSLLSAVLAVAAGVVLLIQPIGGALSLTLLLVVFFIIEGVAGIMYALEHRQQLSGRWGWMLVSGVVDLVLAAIIFGGLPATAAWTLGLLVGIDMIFGGAALIGIAVAARNVPSQPAAPHSMPGQTSAAR